MKTSPFAGLLAGFRGARAEDDKSEDDQARKARRAEEDQKREEEDARRAEEDQRRDDEDARRAEEDGDEPDDKAKGKGRRAEDDGDQDPEADADDPDKDAEEGMDDKEAKAFRRGLAIGRARENVRGSRIFTSAAQVGRPDLAATLAFTTRNSSAEASRIMGTAGAASTGQRAPASREARNAQLGTGGHQPAPRRAGSSWDRSLAKLGIKLPQA